MQMRDTRLDALRGLAALLVAVASAVACTARGGLPDLAWPFIGAARLMAGQNPYGGVYPLDLGLYYPLPAVMLLVPLVPLGLPLATALFVFLSVFLLAYARPPWPIFLSAPFVLAVLWGQWAPLLTAAALLPAAAPLALCKPNMGIPALLYKPTRGKAIGCTVVALVSLIILPTWPLDWLRGLGAHQNFTPLLVLPFGPLLLLLIRQWREKDARLILALACLPQRFPDMLLLWLIPATTRGALLLSIASWVVSIIWHWADLFTISPAAKQAAVLLLYVPCALLSAHTMTAGAAQRPELASRCSPTPQKFQPD